MSRLLLSLALAGLFETKPMPKPVVYSGKIYNPEPAVKRERTAKEKRRKSKRGY